MAVSEIKDKIHPQLIVDISNFLPEANCLGLKYKRAMFQKFTLLITYSKTILLSIGRKCASLAMFNYFAPFVVNDGVAYTT